mmetsp:Transcript_80468/g.142395  ORF Transcript_80468/g.142395 Transcript_80468/m.142395 type:complete len:259 (+) Transcript_80468:430-1206(+)
MLAQVLVKAYLPHIVPDLLQQCALDLIQVRIVDQAVSFDAPPNRERIGASCLCGQSQHFASDLLQKHADTLGSAIGKHPGLWSLRLKAFRGMQANPVTLAVTDLDNSAWRKRIDDQPGHRRLCTDHDLVFVHDSPLFNLLELWNSCILLIRPVVLILWCEGETATLALLAPWIGVDSRRHHEEIAGNPLGGSKRACPFDALLRLHWSHDNPLSPSVLLILQEVLRCKSLPSHTKASYSSPHVRDWVGQRTTDYSLAEG